MRIKYRSLNLKSILLCKYRKSYPITMDLETKVFNDFKLEWIRRFIRETSIFMPTVYECQSAC